jgi:DNA-binding response OmpR family regulator
LHENIVSLSLSGKAANPSAPTHSITEEAPIRMWDTWRVLVLEDDFLQGEHVCDLLLEEGMEPLGPVATAEAAVDLLDTTSVDVAILDIRLQNGLCFKVARTLMQKQIPFLFLTGSVQEVIPAEFQAVPVLLKPFDAQRLFELLRDLVPSHMP